VKNFLTCEFWTFVKLIGVLLILNILLNIIGIEPYATAFISASLVGIFLYILFFIWKFIKVLTMDDSSTYECKKSETMNKALTWLSNLV
jgi:hypothetical protein